MNSFTSRQALADEPITWTYPKLHESESECYVDYYVVNPLTKIKKRIKKKFNGCVPGRNRDAMVQQYIQNTAAKLAGGWNPFTEPDYDYRPNADITSVIADYTVWLEENKRPKTIVDYENRLTHFIAWCKKHKLKYIGDCTPGTIESYLHSKQRSQKWTNRTYNNERTFLSAFFGWCIKRFYLRENPCKSICTMQEEPRQLGILTDKEKSLLVSYLEEHDKWFLLACLMQYYTLIRPNELLHLRLRDIHLGEQFIVVPASISKNHKEQPVALPNRLVKFMLELHIEKFSADKYLFGYGCVPNDKPGNHALLRSRWVKVRDVLGFSTKKKFYSLKSNGIIDLINEEGVLIARDQARHSDISVTNKYAQYGSQTVHEEVKRFIGKM